MNPRQAYQKSQREYVVAEQKIQEFRMAYNAEEDVEKRQAMHAQLEEHENRFKEAMATFVTAIDNLPDPGPIEDADTEVREFDQLYKGTELIKYINHIVGKTEFDGREKEFRQAMLGDHGGRDPNTVPLAMLLDNMDPTMELRLNKTGDETEYRQDVATVINAATGIRQQFPIADRVFGQSQAAFMGASFISVMGGQQDFPYVSGGTTATAKDENEDIDAGAATIQIVSSVPREVGIAYNWGLTTQLRFAPGVLESVLRRDARMAIGDYIDESIIAGVEADAANNIPAIEGLLDLGFAGESSSAPTVDIDAVGFLEFAASHVDGVWANADDNVRYLVPPSMWRKLAYLRVSPMATDFIKDNLRGRFIASRHLPDAAVASEKQDNTFITYAPDSDRGELMVPIWSDLRVTYDTVTLNRKRQTRLAIDTAYDAKRRRNNPWRKQRAQHPA